MRFTALLTVASVLALAGAASAAPYEVQFANNTMPVAIQCPAAMLPCLMSTDATLQVTVTGVTASFELTETTPNVVDLTFTLPDYLAPTGVLYGTSPYFKGSQLTVTNDSWDKSTYPYVTFWSPAEGDGISIGATPNDTGAILVTFFGSEQSFEEGNNGGFTLTGTPEPATWSMMLIGAGLTGAMLRRRKALVA